MQLVLCVVVVCFVFVRFLGLSLFCDSSDLKGFDGGFDPGSGRTLAACLTHASRTVRLQLAGVHEWRTGE